MFFEYEDLYARKRLDDLVFPRLEYPESEEV